MNSLSNFRILQHYQMIKSNLTLKFLQDHQLPSMNNNLSKIQVLKTPHEIATLKVRITGHFSMC